MCNWLVVVVGVMGVAIASQCRADEIIVDQVQASTGDVLELTINGKQQVVAVWGVRAPSVLTQQGLTARSYVADFLDGANPRVELVKTKAGVQYVRVVAEGGILNEKLLHDGYARWDSTFAPNEIDYKLLEEDARAREAGIWATVKRDLPPLRIEVSRNGATSAILIDADGNRALQAKGSIKADPSVADAALLRAAKARALKRAQEEERARRQAEYAAMQAAAARRSYDDALARYSRELAVQRQENALYGWPWYGYRPWYSYGPRVLWWHHTSPFPVRHTVVIKPNTGTRGTGG